MKRFRSIAVGLDLDAEGASPSPGALRAARQARDLARRTGASVRFLHSTFLGPGEEPPAYLDPETHGLTPSAWEALQAASVPFAEEGVATSLHFTKEPAGLELIRWVLAGAADLVVVGKRRHPHERHRIGSIATELMRSCPAPVWLVHPDREVGVGPVLAATDLSEVGTRATELARDIADWYDAALYVVHAYQIPMSLQMSHEPDREARLHDLEAEIRHEILSKLPPRGAGVHVSIRADAPEHLIERAVGELRPAVLVMGCISRSGLAGLLVGSTAERVLPEVDCSLLCIKPQDAETTVRPA